VPHKKRDEEKHKACFLGDTRMTKNMRKRKEGQGRKNIVA